LGDKSLCRVAGVLRRPAIRWIAGVPPSTAPPEQVRGRAQDEEI
jgi:hypothetical protein